MVDKVELSGGIGGFLEDAAIEAGNIMRRHFQPGGVAFSLKENNTPVTVADKAIGEMVASAVASYYHEAVLIREETDFPKRMNNGGLEFVIDELDGTDGYSRDVPCAVFAAAAMRDFVPTHAVVHAPLYFGNPRTYGAEAGRGAWLNSRRIHVSDMKRPRVAIATASAPDERYQAFELAANIVRETGWVVETITSMSFSCAQLAAGNLAAVLFPWDTLHDTVMGDLLVREAGGVTSDLDGNAFDYSKNTVEGYIMANSAETHATLLKMVRRHRK
jgi:myo-inositol-1(or 4)-monophosphatase